MWWMRTRLVLPVTPGGEPAVMTTMSPGPQRPMRRSSSSTWATMASVESTWGPRKVSTPQVRLSWGAGGGVGGEGEEGDG